MTCERKLAKKKITHIHTTVIPFSPQMCPHRNDDVPSETAQEMVAIEGTSNSLNGHRAANGNGAHSNGQSSAKQQRRNPYAPRASDFLNNVSNFKIIESTLRGYCICRFWHFSLIDVNSAQRGSNLPMPSLTLRPRSPSLKPSTNLASSI